MILSEIWIYPVKSLGGIRLTEAHTEEKGLQYDRRWMIVDENGMFQTQRFSPEMALIDVTLQAGGLKIFSRDNPENHTIAPFEPVSEETISVKVWNDVVDAVTVSNAADQWLSNQLGKKVRLVMMPENTQRKADPHYARHDENVSFADGFPYLVISQASLDDLNSRLAEPVSMARFRPNFVITGTKPFAEDEWKSITIGNAAFEVVKPCARCIMTTINQKTAEKGAEPLKTLSTYRKINNKILFGQNVVAAAFGTVKAGDEVTVTQ
ncbi:MOSC domain-containing protein [Dyadobacter flavalbus]|uniref:MOSC domain-containing protein n=1 Tax=Dyadobacter flavalbus TaxID=2579942 RepID=A0A5M8R5Y8_9BACT|nr:MOSC N-terminal beta barrel domain-containing protein [Dyadobacter flavalbus]KAA6441572.1 MOSC domain-containing protein [Dyadobacter flavalbus]